MPTLVTIFSVPKAFDSDFGPIQRNSIRSWMLLPDSEVILCGNEPGVVEICREFNLRHLPDIAQTESGAPIVNDLFPKVEKAARFERLLFVNADVVVTSGFTEALKCTVGKPFLMIGRRWEISAISEAEIGTPGWEVSLANRVRSEGRLYPPWWIDFFGFNRGMWRELPPLLIGRYKVDLVLTWLARHRGITIVDITDAAMMVHQSHKRRPAIGPESSRAQPESSVNLRIAGGWNHFGTVWDADLKMSVDGLLVSPGLARQIGAALLRMAIFPHGIFFDLYRRLFGKN